VPDATVTPPAPAAPAADPQDIVVRDPATGEVVAELRAADEAAVQAAVAGARAAFRPWADTPAGDRAGLLKAWARTLRDHVDELGALVTREMGKPRDDARGGVEAGIGAIEQYAELGPAHRGRRLSGAPDADDVMERHPRGVAAVLLPWNDPVALACAQIAACVVMGNTVVVKPSERAPLAVARAVELLPDELPAGVVTLIQGAGATGAALVAAEGVDLVIHTGSVAAGRDIAVRCAGLLRKAIVELGGKDALIVDRDVDPEWAAEQAALGSFANAGQICVAVERILVHRDVAEPFVDALVRRAEALRVGPGADPETGMGPLVDERHRDAVHAHVAAAVDDGARVRTGGAVPEGDGSFYPPTVLEDVTADMAVWRDETFGPVAPVMVVDSFDDALRIAGETEYGLAGTVLTADERHARRAARELDVGTLKVNAVFGGAPGGAAEPRRSSGLGLGYGPELLDEVSAWRVVHRSAPVPRA
jgi:succinate-semialdehyde dehydrogenase/glutarate-semialdehyde dehydrogenase